MRDRIAIIDINTKKFKAISYKQYDVNNILQIVVTENGKIIGLSNYSAKVCFQLPSGIVYEIPCIIENNTIKVILTKAILNEYGKVIVEVELTSYKQMVTTFSIYLNVEKSINKETSQYPDDDNSIPEYNHYHENMEILSQITQEMIDIILSTEKMTDMIYQKKEDVSLETDDKTIVGAINEVNKKINEIDIENLDMSDYVSKVELENKDYATNTSLQTKADNLFKTDMLTVSSLGGISIGTNLNDMSIQDILTKLLYPYVAPTVSASISYSPMGTIFEYGQLVNVTSITVNITKKSENISNIHFYQNNVMIKELTENISLGGSFIYTFPTEVKITTSISNSYFKVKVMDENKKETTANTVALSFYYPYYYGVIDADIEITEELIKGLTKQVVAKGNKSYTYNPNYQRMVIAYPKSYGVLKSILDPNGFEQINSFSCIELSIVGLDETSQLYYVYSNDASTNSNFTMKFNY